MAALKLEWINPQTVQKIVPLQHFAKFISKRDEFIETTSRSACLNEKVCHEADGFCIFMERRGQVQAHFSVAVVTPVRRYVASSMYIN